LKILVANALSFLGKYSAVALIAAGKFPASPTANTKRAKMNRVTLTLIINATSLTCSIACLAPSKPTNQFPVMIPEVAIPQNACKTAPTDQTPIAQRKPFFGIHPIYETTSKQHTNCVKNREQSGYISVIIIGPMKFWTNKIFPG